MIGEQVSEIYIDNEAIARGEHLKELVKDTFVYKGIVHTADSFKGDDLAVKDGKVFTVALYQYPSIESLKERVLAVGRSLDFYKVGVCPWEKSLYTPWYEIKPENVSHPAVVNLALRVIALEDQLKLNEGVKNE